MDSWQQGQSSPFLGGLRKPSSSILHPDPSPAKKKGKNTGPTTDPTKTPTLNPTPKENIRKLHGFFSPKNRLTNTGSRKATASYRGTKLVWNSVISTFKAPSKRKDAVKDEMIWAMRPRGSGSPRRNAQQHSRCPYVLPTEWFFL